MTPFWVEVRDHKSVLLSRQQFSTTPVLIGRAAQCAVLLDDPFVAGVHAQLAYVDSGLVLNALPSLNGMSVKGQKVQSLAIGQDANANTVQMGKSKVTVRSVTESFLPERPLSDSKEIAAGALGWPAIVVMTAVMFGIEFFGVWAGMVRESRVNDWLSPVLTLGGFALVWSLVWALLNRVFGGVLNFRQHLFIAMAAILMASVLNEALDLAGYGFALRHIGLIDTAMRYVTAAVACYFHLKIISSENMRVKGIALASVLIGIFLVSGVARFEQLKRSLGSDVYAGSKAPMFQFKQGQALDQILLGFDKNKALIDEQRKEKPGDAGEMEGLFDD
jgi:hypothetical protein